MKTEIVDREKKKKYTEKSPVGADVLYKTLIGGVVLFFVTRKAVSKEVMIAMGTVLGLTVAPIATPIVAGGVISTWLLKAISSGKETKR